MTLFIVLDDAEMKWCLIDAESMEMAVQKARTIDLDPFFVIDEKVATKVWQDKKLRSSIVPFPVSSTKMISRWYVRLLRGRDIILAGFYIGTLSKILAQITEAIKQSNDISFLSGIVIYREKK